MNYELNFTIPQGPTGPTGVAGPTGPAGPAGIAGTAPKLTIGTVTTAAPGTDAEVIITPVNNP